MLVNHSENRENILVDNKTKFGRTIRAYHRLATVKKIAKYEDEKERPRARKIVRRGEYKNKRRHLRKKGKQRWKWESYLSQILSTNYCISIAPTSEDHPCDLRILYSRSNMSPVVIPKTFGHTHPDTLKLTPFSMVARQVCMVFTAKGNGIHPKPERR